MITSFAPSFQHFQKDIERFLKNEGKCEKNEHGQTVYRGYQAAVDQMFRVYMKKEAFAPLVAEFRTWNWEWNYDQYLVELSVRLKDAGHWSFLKELWGAVLLDSLYRLRSYASELQTTSEVGEYLEMIARVEQRRKA